MPFAVFLTNDAARDLEELYDYIALHDAPQSADHSDRGNAMKLEMKIRKLSCATDFHYSS